MLTMSFSAQRRTTGIAAYLAVITVMVLALIASTAQSVEFPKLTGRVVDNANLLPPAVEQQLTQQLKAHEDKTTNQVVVVTVNSLQGMDIADYGYQLGRHWGIGQADANNGVLLIVAPKQRKVRIEVGYGLEATLTDALSRHIIDTDIISRFRKNDFPGGIQAGVTAILGILGGSIDVAQYQQKRPKTKSSQLDLIPTLFTFVFIALFVGAIFRLMMGVLASTGLVFAVSFIVGLIISGMGFAILVAIIATLFHLFNSVGGGRGGRGGRYYGGYGGGGFGGGGGFSGGGGSFGGGGASGGW